MSEHSGASARPSADHRWVRALAGAAVAAPLVYLLLLGARPYPGDVWLKTSMCVLLAALAWRARQRLFTAALLFSAAGDAFLGVDGERLFVPGLVSFLVTHVLYSVLFIGEAKRVRAPLSAPRMLALVGIPAFAMYFMSLLWPNLGTLTVPVLAYMLAIVVMALLSLRLASWAAPIGAVLFVASDSFIALGKFLWDAPWISPAVWITYALAQLLIAFGLLTRSRAHEAIPSLRARPSAGVSVHGE